MNYGKNQPKDLPDVSSLLSSLVRLMSSYMREPSVSQAMTLVHLMDRLEQHPDLPDNPAAAVAIRQARVIWDEELMMSRSKYTFLNKNMPDDGSLH